MTSWDENGLQNQRRDGSKCSEFNNRINNDKSNTEKQGPQWAQQTLHPCKTRLDKNTAA